MANQKISDDKWYSDEYDAIYNPQTDEWLESKCDDPNCEYCVNRPARPSEMTNGNSN